MTAHETQLRPIERRVLQLAEEGVSPDEIGRRFRRSPDGVRRVMEMARLPRQGRSPAMGDVLRPIERRVLRWRATGADYADFAHRFRRSPEFLARVEGLARYKLGG